MSNQIAQNSGGSYFDTYERQANAKFNSFQLGQTTGVTTFVAFFNLPSQGQGYTYRMTYSGTNATTPNTATTGFSFTAVGGAYANISNGTVQSGNYTSTPTTGYNVGSGLTMPTIPTVQPGTNQIICTITGVTGVVINHKIQVEFI